MPPSAEQGSILRRWRSFQNAWRGQKTRSSKARLVNEKNGKEAKIGRYYIDFDRYVYEVLEDHPVQAYRQVDGIAPDDTFEYEQWERDIDIVFNLFCPEEYRRTDKVQFEIPSTLMFPENVSSTFKIVAYKNGIACADSGWFDASVPDTVITLTLEDDGMDLYGGGCYLFELYREDLEEPTNIGRAYVNYNPSEFEFYPHLDHAF